MPTESPGVLGRRWETMALLAVLLLALMLRVWGLEQNGWGAQEGG
jgi:hypothetical protein